VSAGHTATEVVKNAGGGLGAAHLVGLIHLPDIVSFLTILWLAALLIERAYKAWCWYVARRGNGVG
jgi:hypothetical protein